jgi:hypothetical protein
VSVAWHENSAKFPPLDIVRESELYRLILRQVPRKVRWMQTEFEWNWGLDSKAGLRHSHNL